MTPKQFAARRIISECLPAWRKTYVAPYERLEMALRSIGCNDSEVETYMSVAKKM